MEKTVTSVRNGGRPRIKEEDRKGKPVSFRVDELTRMAIDEKVKESKLAMGEFLRRALKSAKITPAEYDDCFHEIENFKAANLLELIAVKAEVVQPLSNKELKCLKDLYRFAQDVNALVKKSNESLDKWSAQIDFSMELARLLDEFNEIKDYFLRLVTGEHKKKSV